MKKETLDPFETLLTHSKACCVTLSEYNNTQNFCFGRWSPSVPLSLIHARYTNRNVTERMQKG